MMMLRAMYVDILTKTFTLSPYPSRGTGPGSMRTDAVTHTAHADRPPAPAQQTRLHHQPANTRFRKTLRLPVQANAIAEDPP